MHTLFPVCSSGACKRSPFVAHSSNVNRRNESGKERRRNGIISASSSAILRFSMHFISIIAFETSFLTSPVSLLGWPVFLSLPDSVSYIFSLQSASMHRRTIWSNQFYGFKTVWMRFERRCISWRFNATNGGKCML